MDADRSYNRGLTSTSTTHPVPARSYAPRTEPFLEELGRRFRPPRLMPLIIDALILGAIVGLLLTYFRVPLLAAQTTTTGGDTGAHVFVPWFLRTHLLPRGQLSGWSPDWFAGFPLLHFYFPLVPTLQALLSFAIPYEVAFKIGTVLGTFAFPVAVYLLFRLLRFPFPGPVVAAVVSLGFLFLRSFSIFGGNIASSLSGEYSFSLSLALCLVFLGLAYRVATEDHGRPLLAAAVLALAVLSHLVPVIVVVLFSPVLAIWAWRRHGLRSGSVRLAAMFGIAFAFTAFWSVPFLARLGFTANMRWVPVEGWTRLLPGELQLYLIGAVSGAVLAAFALDRRFLFFLGPAAIGAGVYFFLPEGHLFNGRFAPFWFLGVVLATGYFLATLISITLGAMAPYGGGWWRRSAAALAIVVPVAAVALMGAQLVGSKDDTYVDDWIRWNYDGYERKPPYGELRALMDRMAALPRGRVMWEPSPEQGEFGTPIALMTLPYFASQPSMEGLLFESSITTPFHFLTAAEVADQPSNPIAGLPYASLDLRRGIAHMRLFDVRYFVSWSDRVREAATSASKDLRHVEDVGRFSIFELDHAQVVIPRFQPVVLAGADWEEASIDWFSELRNLEVPLVAEGAADWARTGGSRSSLPRAPLAHGGAVVSARMDDDEISFTTDAVGEPHWVRTSYFPNWTVEGAEGPYLSSPSTMIVIPTQREVRLRYARTPYEWLGLVMTFLAPLGILARRTLSSQGRVRRLADRFWLRHRRGISRLFIFALVSGAATLVDFGLFNLFLAVDLMPLLVSTTVAYTMGIVTSYLLNRRFTFRGGGRESRMHEVGLFVLISLVGLGLNNLAVGLAARLVSADRIGLNVAKVAAGAVTWLLKFAFIQRWVFPSRPDDLVAGVSVPHKDRTASLLPQPPADTQQPHHGPRDPAEDAGP
jgi:putative flippase GtrA